MKPTVQILRIHLLDKKIVSTAGPADALEKVDIPSPLERYLGRPIDSSFDHLAYIDYPSRYSIVDHPTSPDAHPDVCNPVRFRNFRTGPMLCIINSVHPRNHEPFALRYFFDGSPPELGKSFGPLMMKYAKIYMMPLGNWD
jgi:hypothetical protein